MKKKSDCAGCAYWRVLSTCGGSKVYACHYMVDTGKMRSCEPGADCTRRAAKIRRRRRFTHNRTEEVETHDY